MVLPQLLILNFELLIKNYDKNIKAAKRNA